MEGGFNMHLTRKDARATLWVGAAAIFYGLWLTGTVAADMSTRLVAGIVFALGWLGCTSDVEGMKAVFGVDGEQRPHMTYVVIASLAGTVAFVAGILAIVGANETMLATLVVSTVVLWLISTVRHAITAPTGLSGEHMTTPLGKAA
jgi:hypothetical protein